MCEKEIWDLGSEDFENEGVFAFYLFIFNFALISFYSFSLFILI